MQLPILPVDYHPSEDEDYMCDNHLSWFRQKLINWRNELLEESNETVTNLKNSSLQEPDKSDRATIEFNHSLELRTRDRERKLIGKIEDALSRIDDRSYGYCEESGEPIGLKRLEARPIATLSVEAQERHERLEKIYRDE